MAKWYQKLTRLREERDASEDLRDAHGQRDGAAGTALKLFAGFHFVVGELGGRIAHVRELLLVTGRGLQVGVDGEVVAGGQAAGGDQGHDADQALDQHGAVADHAGVAFLVDHLRRGAAGDQGVESR